MTREIKKALKQCHPAEINFLKFTKPHKTGMYGEVILYGKQHAYITKEEANRIAAQIIELIEYHKQNKELYAFYTDGNGEKVYNYPDIRSDVEKFIVETVESEKFVTL